MEELFMENYSFGKTLRELRHGKNMTQSRLAELLSVSAQSVSKWENDVGYPDLTLLAPISEIFGVTVDYLLGKGENTKARDIQEAREKTRNLWQEECDNSAECISIWRELLKKYPSDNECRNALAFELRAGCKILPENEKRARAEEAANLYETVLDESKNSEERCFARSELVWIYGNLLGESDLAAKIAKQAGSINCNTPHLMAQIENHPEKKHWQQYEVWYMTGGLAFAIADQKYEYVGDEIFAYRTALKIIDTVCVGSHYAYFDSYFSAYFRRCICLKRAEIKDFDDSIYDDIKAMLDSCKRADEEALGRHFFDGNPFMDSVYYERSLRDGEMKFAKELLSRPIFDEIRKNEKFAELAKSL